MQCECFPSVTEGPVCIPLQVINVEEEGKFLDVVLLASFVVSCDVLDESKQHRLRSVCGLRKTFRIGIFRLFGIEVQLKTLIGKFVSQYTCMMYIHHGRVHQLLLCLLNHIHLGGEAIAKETSTALFLNRVGDMQCVVHSVESPRLEIVV